MILTRLLKKFVLLQIVNGKQNPRIARLYTARTCSSLFSVKLAFVPQLGPRVPCLLRANEYCVINPYNILTRSCAQNLGIELRRSKFHRVVPTGKLTDYPWRFGDSNTTQVPISLETSALNVTTVKASRKDSIS